MASLCTRSMENILARLARLQHLKTLAELETLPLLDLMAMARLAASSSACKNFTCGIINVKSGACSEDCIFCAQSAHYTTKALTYPFLHPDLIASQVEAKLQQNPFDYLGLVASGPELTDRDFEQLCQSASLIHSRFAIRLCASIGFLRPERALALKQAGFTSCHHNLESAKSYFSQICTTPL